MGKVFLCGGKVNMGIVKPIYFKLNDDGVLVPVDEPTENEGGEVDG